MPLPIFQLPLRPNGPPTGYGWSDRPLSEMSTTTAFNSGLNNRDLFRGILRCVICGSRRPQHCHIIMQSQPSVWSDLRDRSWIPLRAKGEPRHEPRNGLLLCPTHHNYFDQYDYFIRFCPDVQKFVLINYSDEVSLRPFHSKAIAIDVKDRHAPFPSIFIIHEMRVRGHNPFAPTGHDLPDDIPWQDWILAEGVLNNISGSFDRDKPPPHNQYSNSSASAQAQLQPTSMTMNTGEASSNRLGRVAVVPLNADAINGILKAMYAMPSWKSCQMEGTSWTGTGEENIKNSSSIQVGVQDHLPEAPSLLAHQSNL